MRDEPQANTRSRISSGTANNSPFRGRASPTLQCCVFSAAQEIALPGPRRPQTPITLLKVVNETQSPDIIHVRPSDIKYYAFSCSPSFWFCILLELKADIENLRVSHIIDNNLDNSTDIDDISYTSDTPSILHSSASAQIMDRLTSDSWLLQSGGKRAQHSGLTNRLWFDHDSNLRQRE